MSTDDTNCPKPTTYIQQDISFDDMVTSYICNVRPLKALISQRHFKTPVFHLNTYVTACQIDTFINSEEMPEYFKWSVCYLPNDLKEDDAFEVHFTIEHNVPVVRRNTMNSSVDITPTKLELYERLKMMYHAKPCTDIKISVGDKEFLAHKSILFRSPVFAAMFSHKMLENNENRIDIKDVNPNAFEILLKFLYLGEVDEIKMTESTNNLIFDLMEVANIYQIEDLKIKLADIIEKYVNISNAVDYLILADKYNVPSLKKTIMLFIKTNSKNIKETKSFKDMMQKHQGLMAEMLCYFIN
ncbi:speckle-type POZ protein B-like isoform X1 [Vespa mandarinia]|uniref:speckle-type POZ protein B-like isoform X1 n=1 Tax=Vespa mandarinia TaxID=7446 RepID=UPI00160DECF7|nr:speckle-type POZ protein B-like isoform X1 [Vespa mandarinia]